MVRKFFNYADFQYLRAIFLYFNFIYIIKHIVTLIHTINNNNYL